MTETEVQPSTDQPPARDPEAPYGRKKDGTPRRKGGPPKGTRPGGKQKGSKNKATIAREKEEARLLNEATIYERAYMEARTELLAEQAKTAAAKGKKLGKEALDELMQLTLGMTAYYQPLPNDANPNADEEKFDKYIEMAARFATNLAPFQSPRFSAMMVGATVVSKIVVEGGMPDDFNQGTAPALPPGTVVSADEVAEDAEVIPLPKVAAG